MKEDNAQDMDNYQRMISKLEKVRRVQGARQNGVPYRQQTQPTLRHPHRTNPKFRACPVQVSAMQKLEQRPARLPTLQMRGLPCQATPTHTTRINLNRNSIESEKENKETERSSMKVLHDCHLRSFRRVHRTFQSNWWLF